MGKRNSATLPLEVYQLALQIQDWRRSKKGPASPMPQELWDAATRLAGTFGICRIARTTGLDYGWLRKKTEQSALQPESVAAGFLELPMGVMTAGAHPPEFKDDRDADGLRGPGSTVDISMPDGARIQIRLDASQDVDTVGIVAAFLRRGH
jgi:hypothetical protein